MSEVHTSTLVDDPAGLARPWRWLSIAIATVMAVLVVSNRIEASEAWAMPAILLLVFELAPLVAVVALARVGARKGVVVAMLLGMLYVAHAALIATSPDSRWLGGLELLLALALFGSLFMVGRALLAEERRLNP